VARRVLAAGLFLLGGALALQPASAVAAPSSPTVVSVHDIAAGSVLSAADVRIVSIPDGVRAAGSLATTAAVQGHVLAGAARAGEPITDARLVDLSPDIPAPGDPGRSVVPIRVADPGVGDLLHPGSRVDVVAAGESGRQVLADLATVVAVTNSASGSPPAAGERDRGRLVLLELPADAAAKVAAASLGGPVAVTLR
jgi:Flp pilus assembly protein CpaB